MARTVWAEVGGVVLLVVATACGSSGDEGTSVATDARAAVIGSAEQVVEAGTFRFEQGLEGAAAELATACSPSGAAVEGAVDLDRELILLSPTADGHDVVVTRDTAFVRADALAGWTIDGEWVSAPLDDPTLLLPLATATGLPLGPEMWESASNSNPAGALELLAESVVAVEEAGEADVRGVPTTRFDLEVDPALAGTWTGGSTTSTATPGGPTTLGGSELDELRESAVRSFLQDYPDAPREAQDAMRDGDPGPAFEHAEATTGTTIDPAERAFAESYLQGDVAGGLAEVEELTGTTLDPALEELLAAGRDGDVPGVFEALTEIEASAFLDDEGRLQRLEQRVWFGDRDEDPEPWISAWIEYFDVGSPLVDEVPVDAVVPVDALDATAVADPSSPCGVGLDD